MQEACRPRALPTVDGAPAELVVGCSIVLRDGDAAVGVDGLDVRDVTGRCTRITVVALPLGDRSYSRCRVDHVTPARVGTDGVVPLRGIAHDRVVTAVAVQTEHVADVLRAVVTGERAPVPDTRPVGSIVVVVLVSVSCVPVADARRKVATCRGAVRGVRLSRRRDTE